MSLQRVALRSAVDLPQAHGVVRAAAGEQLAVCRETDGVNPVHVSAEGGLERQRFHIEQVDGSPPGPGDSQLLTVR